MDMMMMMMMMMHYLSTSITLFYRKQEKIAKFTKLSFCQKLIFWHQTSFFTLMFSVSILCKQRIRLLYPLQNCVLGGYTVFSMSVIHDSEILSTFNDFAI